MNTNGFIVISRKILTWKYYKYPMARLLWFHILLVTNWEESYFQGQKLPRGSFVTSVQTLADDATMSRTTVKRWLNTFEMDHQITKRSTNNFTIITIVNYDFYQSLKKVVDQQKYNDMSRPTSRTMDQVDGPKGGRQVDHSITNNHKPNNNNNTNTVVENDSTGPDRSAWFEAWWTAYPKKVGKKPCHDKFLAKCKTEQIYQQMMKALEAQKLSDTWQRGYIPNPQTWLNQERWTDDISAYQDHPAQSKGRQRRPDFTADFKELESHETAEEILARRLRDDI